jgi:hypothetical protein
MKRFVLLIVAVVAVSCSKSSTAPTPVTTTTTTTTIPSTFTLSGRVTSSSTGAGVSSATVRADGINNGRSTTTAADGSYTLSPLTAGTFNVSFNAPFYVGVGQLVTLNSNQTLNQALTFIPVFSASGVGDNVFTIPATVSRIRIMARYTGNSSNFVVRIAGSLVVNELIGTFWGTTTFDGTYLTSGGTTAITNSSGVSWTFTEVRQ